MMDLGALELVRIRDRADQLISGRRTVAETFTCLDFFSSHPLPATDSVHIMNVFRLSQFLPHVDLSAEYVCSGPYHGC